MSITLEGISIAGTSTITSTLLSLSLYSIITTNKISTSTSSSISSSLTGTQDVKLASQSSTETYSSDARASTVKSSNSSQKVTSIVSYVTTTASSPSVSNTNSNSGSSLIINSVTDTSSKSRVTQTPSPVQTTPNIITSSIHTVSNSVMTYTVPVHSSSDETQSTVTATDVLTPTATNDNTFKWLPTNIIVQSYPSNESSTVYINTATSELPGIIAPPGTITQPENSTLITIAFKIQLNYAFLVNNLFSSAQIFNFLPLVLQYPFLPSSIDSRIDPISITYTQSMSMIYAGTIINSNKNGTTVLSFSSNEGLSVPAIQNTYYSDFSTNEGENTLEPLQSSTFSKILSLTTEYPSSSSEAYNPYDMNINVKQIVPFVNNQQSYIIAVAEVYFPSDLVEQLQAFISNPNSTLYRNPDPKLHVLASLIDLSISITELLDDDCRLINNSFGSSMNTGSPSSHLLSSIDTIANKFAANLGSLDLSEAISTAKMCHPIKYRFFIFLLTFSLGMLVLLLFCLYAFKNLYEIPFFNKRIHISEKDIPIKYNRFSKRFIDSYLPTYSEKLNGWDVTSKSKSSVTSNMVKTSEDTMYSNTHQISYKISPDGNFYYNGQTSNPFSSETYQGGTNTIDSLRKYLYQDEDSNTNTFINSKATNLGNFVIDENGYLEVFNSGDIESNIILDNTNLVEDYNNKHTYKVIHTYGDNHSSYLKTSKESTEGDNEYTGKSNNEPNNPFIDGVNSDDFLYMNSNSDTRFIDYGDYDNIHIDEIDDDEIDDVHVDELDELDEELYRRLSKIINQRVSAKKV